MFTIRQMRYFDALVSTRHFGTAAEKAGVSQPALSVQIAEMEKAVGLPLFERISKGVILTPAGRDFLPVIRNILQQMKILDDMSSFYRGTFQGSLRLGIISTLAPYLLPALLPQVSKLYPDLTLEIVEAKTETLAQKIITGNLDLVIAAEPFPLETMKKRHLFSDYFYLATAIDDEAYLHGIGSPDDIDFDRLLLLEEGHCFRNQALAVCKTGHFLQEFGATSLSTLLQLVTYGHGITLIPQIACLAEKHNGRLQIQPFRNRQPKRDIALFWRERSPRHKDYKQFADVIKAAAMPLLSATEKQIDQAMDCPAPIKAIPALSTPTK